jgi:hypothetical protein
MLAGRALTLLLEDWGYDPIRLDSYLTGVVDELLEGAHLLLFVPREDEGRREAFLDAMGKCTLQVADMAGDRALHGRRGYTCVNGSCLFQGG